MNLEMIFQKFRKSFNNFQIIQSFIYFFLRFFFKPKIKKRIKLGYCPLCGRKSIMLIDNIFLRDTGFCIFCTASTRYKSTAEIIKRIIILKLLFNDLKYTDLREHLDKMNLYKISLIGILKILMQNGSINFWIYEPSSIGAICNILRKYPKFIYSEYFPYPNLKGGDIFNGVRHEDLQSLAFKDNTFDIIITQDVLEHIERPFKALKEIYRTLKPNGVHIFTVPLDKNKKTTEFFNQSGKIIKDKIYYHKDPLRSKGAIVYTEFGNDIIELLNRFNFKSIIYTLSKDIKNGILINNNIIISIKK